MILMLRLALVGLTLHQIGIPPGQSMRLPWRKDLVRRVVWVLCQDQVEIEDRETGRGGGGGGGGGGIGCSGGTTKRVRDQADKKAIKGDAGREVQSSQIRELSAELTVRRWCRVQVQ